MKRRAAYFAALSMALAAAAPASAEPGYDLASDRLARIELAQRELAGKARPRVLADVFVVVGSGSGGALIESALKAYFNGRFEQRPERAVTVYLFANADAYQAYCRNYLREECISPYGFYRPDLRRIVMNAGPGLGTLTHELVHPIVETDFPRAPTWLDEGLASLFEAPVLPRPGAIHGRKNWRYPRLVAALANREQRGLVSVERLFALSDGDFRNENEDLNYALARYFCQWLDSKNQLWPFYRAWRQNVAHDPSGAQAFAAATGLTPEQASPLFLKWLRALK